jgi:hypothetical protein
VNRCWLIVLKLVGWPIDRYSSDIKKKISPKTYGSHWVYSCRITRTIAGVFKTKDQSMNIVDVFLWFSFVAPTDDNQCLIKLWPYPHPIIIHRISWHYSWDIDVIKYATQKIINHAIIVLLWCVVVQYSNVILVCLLQGCTNCTTILEWPLNSRCQEGDMK